MQYPEHDPTAATVHDAVRLVVLGDDQRAAQCLHRAQRAGVELDVLDAVAALLHLASRGWLVAVGPRGIVH